LKKDISKVKEILANKKLSSAGKSSSLIAAVTDKNFEMVKVIVDAGADVNSCEEVEGMSVLLLAAMEGDQKMIRFLMDKGAIVDEFSRWGTE
jgi:ankyrin repeat protein